MLAFMTSKGHFVPDLTTHPPLRTLARLVLIVVMLLTLGPASVAGQMFRGYYEDGSLRYLAHKKKRQEVVSFYFPSGKLQIEATFRRDKLDGLCRSYFENGRVRAETNFERNRRDGSAKYFYPSGILMAQLRYHRDRLLSGRYYNIEGTPSASPETQRLAREQIAQSHALEAHIKQHR
jgi:hypothetical protein